MTTRSMTCSCRLDSSRRARTRHTASSGTTRASGIGWRGSEGARSWSQKPSAWWTSASPCSPASPETTGSATSYLCWPKTLQFLGQLALPELIGSIGTWLPNASASFLRGWVVELITILMTFYLLFYFLTEVYRQMDLPL